MDVPKGMGVEIQLIWVKLLKNVREKECSFVGDYNLNSFTMKIIFQLSNMKIQFEKQLLTLNTSIKMCKVAVTVVV